MTQDISTLISPSLLSIKPLDNITTSLSNIPIQNPFANQNKKSEERKLARQKAKQRTKEEKQKSRNREEKQY